MVEATQMEILREVHTLAIFVGVKVGPLDFAL